MCVVQTENMSSGGLFFIAPGTWTVGADINCEIHLPAVASGRIVTVRAWGRILRVTELENGRMGIAAVCHYEFPARTHRRITASRVVALPERASVSIPSFLS